MGSEPRAAAAKGKRGAAPHAGAGPRGAAAATAGPLVWLVLGALAALLLFAPPHSNYFWALNGFRSVELPVRIGLLAAAAACAVVARGRSDSRALWFAIAVALALVLSLGLPERVHLLGDTGLRIRAIAAFNADRFRQGLGEWAQQIHAQPLDLVLNYLLPSAWARAGLSVIEAVQLGSLLQGLAFLLLLWPLSARLSPAPGTRVRVCMVLSLSGLLQAFAGYAESVGLVLVASAWWWLEMLGPLDRRARVVRLALSWLVFLLLHRVALVLLPAMVWRGLRAHHPGDTPAGRRESLVATLVVAIAGAVVVGLSSGHGRLGGDFGDLFAVLGAWTRGRRVPSPSDVINLALLVTPLAFVALAILRDVRGTARERAVPSGLFLLTALSLSPLIITLLTGPHELGGHRDWDTAALPGFTLTLAALATILALPAARARAVLVAAVPVLALLAGSWVAVNSDTAAVEARAAALASQPPRLEDEPLSMLEVFLGERDMSHRDAAAAAPHFERAYALAPNPRLLLLAAEARAREGNFAAARADVAKAWASGLLNPRNQESAHTLSRMIEALERQAAGLPADSVAASP